MALDVYMRSGSRMLRCGYTTGTCAALAAAGATTLLLTGTPPEKILLTTPKGIPVEVVPAECKICGESALCSVVKDSGDDPDVTDGIVIRAEVRKTESGIEIEGGKGIGRITKAGLDQPVGSAAINSVPRQMIAAAVEDACAEVGYSKGIAVEISAPEGEEIAKKTYNAHLGIEGGISVLGTSGIVEPMSEKALVDTVALEIRQIAQSGSRRLILTPGEYGIRFIREKMPELGQIRYAKCSNYIGDAIDIAAAEGFSEVLLVGHIGKMIKLAGGIMNTHSHEADCRRELFCAHAALKGADQSTCAEIMNEVTTDGCISVLDAHGLRGPVMESLLQAMQTHLERRSAGVLSIGAVVFSNEYGLLGQTRGAQELTEKWSRL